MKSKYGLTFSEDDSSSEETHGATMHVAAVKEESSNAVKIQQLTKQVKKLKGYIRQQQEMIGTLESALDKSSEQLVKLAASQQKQHKAMTASLEEFRGTLKEYRTKAEADDKQQAAREQVSAIYQEGFCLQSVGDYQGALKLFNAIKHESPKAKFRAAQIYFMDTKFHDAEKCFEYALSAAKSGVPEAMMMVGRLYEDGTGTKANKSQAYQWYQKADLSGIYEAKGSLKLLVNYSAFKAKDLVNSETQNAKPKGKKSSSHSTKPNLK